MAPKSNNDKPGFSAREARALLWLLPVLAVVSWLVWEISRIGGTPTAGSVAQSVQHDTIPENTVHEIEPPAPESTVAENTTPALFEFDPNTVEYHDLVRLGFERGEALGIIKYRERGKIFEIPEDFAACYQVSEAMYRQLKPYIRIGEKYRLKPFENRTAAITPSLRGAGSDEAIQNTETGSLRDSSANAIQTPRNEWVKSESQLPTLVDLNTADSAALISVVGIGQRTVVSIMEYRERLGGFAFVEQLAEVRGVTEQNYERIIEQIYLDPAVIRKIDVNFAPAKTLAAHPYMRAEALRKLLKQRQLKGGWRTVEELEQDDIFTTEELEKLGHYLIFN